MDRPPPAKRPRLSMACNICRQRKVKCDAEYPKCRNCRVRNQNCLTTDPQRPGCPGVREWLEVPEKPPSTAVTTEVHDTVDRLPAAFPPKNAAPRSLAVEEGAEVGAESEVSPIRQPFDTSVNTEHGTNRTKILGGSSSQCLAKSLDVYFQAVRMKPISGLFRHGMRHAEELDLALTLVLPELPDPDRRERFLSVYRSRVHTLYPVFNLSILPDTIENLASLSTFKSLPRDDVPLLVSAYLIMGIGVDEESQCPTEEGERYLHAAAGLLAHIIVVPYLPTVQALLLLTIAYRGHNQEGLAWQTLGIAIRISYTLGIHRPSSTKFPPQDNLHKRIWVTCCCLEKLMHIASGWPTLISEDLMAPSDTLDLTKDRFLHWHLGLATYQGSISQHIYSYKPSTRSVRQILLDTARLDRGLLSWANEIPSELRPGNDIICSNEEFHIVALLSIEYHGAMIALHRAALIAPKSKIEQEVMKHCPDDPSRFRLANGESVCVNSARAIAKLSIELQDRGSDSCLIPTGTAGLACIALAIYLMKHPASRLQAMDMQLLKACLQYSSTRFAQCNFDPRYIEGLAVIYDQLHARLEGQAATEVTVGSPIKTVDTTYHKNYRQIAGATSYKQTADGYSHGHLPTPSSYDPATPLVQQNNATSTASATRRAHSFSHPASDIRNGTHSDWPSLPNHPHTQCISLDPTENSYLDQVTAADPVSLPSGIEEVFPFEGFNVEELWNWMLYFDSPRATEVVAQ
ncbi:hypothetical protein BJY04DRAFT_223125 [Aspergillus karnatakaensis]|uniref:uncharacterized protein n=1 Tax=Aspergillus karnatakaensis TaxID=1810916 RepID=UPI003CCC9E60